MKLPMPKSAAESLAIVRDIAEHATTRKAERKLRCVPLRASKERVTLHAWRPWSGSFSSSWGLI